MSLVSPWNHCWSILTSTSAEEISKLVDNLERDKSDVFRKFSSIAECNRCWKARQLSEHDFMHRVKVTIDDAVGDQVRREARYLVSNLVQVQRKIVG